MPLAENTPEISVDKTAGPEVVHRVGTLAYTRAALLTVMFWMLLGDCCLQIMESVPALIPLQLKWAGASDALIGFITGSIPFFIATLINPFIGLHSDRHRGRLGRRRPFLLWCTPGVVLSLVLLGGAGWLAVPVARATGFSVNGTTIFLIGAFNLIFAVFNTYVLQVYQFLFVDVIPEKVMGRFIGLYRAVGAVAGFIFHRWIFGHAETHAWLIYAGSGCLYAVAFLLLVWRVKEGEYPEPATRARRRDFREVCADYFRECFGSWFYIKVYLLTFCFWSAIVPFNTFVVFFATEAKSAGFAPTLGVSLEEFGRIKGWISLCQVPVFFLIGPFLDRFHPLRAVIVAFAVLTATFWLSMARIQNGGDFLFWGLVNAMGMGMFAACQLVVFPRVLPREKYGQFFTANQIFGVAGLVVTPVLCGRMLDAFHDYRLIYAWAGTFTLAGLFASISLFRHWLRLGGDTAYACPVVPAPAERG